jgi:hypothetical protein
MQIVYPRKRRNAKIESLSDTGVFRAATDRERGPNACKAAPYRSRL